MMPAIELAAHLVAGGPALFPTDTLPALAARFEAASQLWALKVRPADKPLILMGAHLAQLVAVLGVPWREEWLAQANRCWPGAVTLVLPIEGKITEALHPGGTTLGLRVPACARAQELLLVTGPLATTSANRSGEPPATTAGEAADRFPAIPLLGPLPWPEASGQASTVMAWQAGGGWPVLRVGAGIVTEAPSP
jgi:L-threonylcarbamoyladenylate synthase